MFLEEFLASPESIKTFITHAEKLREIGAYALLLEMLARKATSRHADDVANNLDMTAAAVAREAWTRGYSEALLDIFDFGRHAPRHPASIPHAGFSAAESLVRDKTISEQEYLQLTGKPFINDMR